MISGEKTILIGRFNSSALTFSRRRRKTRSWNVTGAFFEHMLRFLARFGSMSVTKILCLAAIALIGPFAIDEARADFRVCNGTQKLVGVAIGYRAEEGWVSEGWWQIPATSCETLIEGRLFSRYYYVYAEDASGGGRWGGDINMCVSDTEFKVIGVQDCFARGFQRMGFKEYDTGRQGSWMVQLSDSQEPQGTSSQ